MGMKAAVTDIANAPLFCPKTEPLLQLRVYPRQDNFSLPIFTAFPHMNQGRTETLSVLPPNHGKPLHPKDPQATGLCPQLNFPS